MDNGSLYLSETIKSLKGLKSTAEKAIAQIDDSELYYKPDPESNSVAVIIQHMSGNMISRFTSFLTTDGEKPSRNRDAEFEHNGLSREELTRRWNEGWKCVMDAVSELKPQNLSAIVTIRGEEHTVLRALNRQLVHYAYHTGQIVYLCKLIKSSAFVSLSVPKKKSGEK